MPDWVAERSQFELSGDFARVRKQPNLVGLRRFRTQHREELLQCTPTPRRRQDNLVRGQFRGTNEQSRAPAGLATCRESAMCVSLERSDFRPEGGPHMGFETDFVAENHAGEQ